jgi:heme a synthase
VIAIALLTAVSSFFARGLPRWGSRLAVAVFLGTLAQAPLGYLAVHTDLRWPIVAAHLLLSMAILAGAVVLAVEAASGVAGHADDVVPAELRRAGLALAASGAALLVSGSLATASGPHSGGGAAHVDRLWRLQPLVYAHAASVGVFALVLVFVLGYLASRRDRSPRLFALGVAVFVLLLAQMGIGEAQYRTHLPWPLVLVHVGVAAGVWAALVAFVTVLWRPPAALARGRRVD